MDWDTNIKPFIKWAGGKRQLIEELDAILSEAGQIDTYVEPFLGGGAFLFHILANYPSIKNVLINDSNKCLVNAYKAIRIYPDKVINELNVFKNEYNSLPDMNAKKQYYLDKREVFNYCLSAIDERVNAKLAALFIFINKTCFNALYRVNRKGEFNVPFGKRKTFNFDEDVIVADSKALQNVSISNGDYSHILLSNKILVGEVLYYFDPPYKPLDVSSKALNQYTNDIFDDSEQERLKSFCDILSDSGKKVVVSNSDCKDGFFDNLYSDERYKIRTVEARRVINCKGNRRGKINEIIITNF